MFRTLLTFCGFYLVLFTTVYILRTTFYFCIILNLPPPRSSPKNPPKTLNTSTKPTPLHHQTDPQNLLIMLILDILITLLIFLILIMIFSGFISLLERKIMATFQNRIGPGLFLFGLFTPIFDGVKLILKFNLIIFNIEIFYLLFFISLSFVFCYVLLYVLPFSNIILLNSLYNHFLFLIFHTLLNVFNTFVVGCFIINTCFVYVATIRNILCSLISEIFVIFVFLIFFSLDFFCFFNFMFLNYSSVFISKLLMLPPFFFIIVLLIFFLHINIGLFEYVEAEAELVAGVITEYSGIFFCFSSLVEIFHQILIVFIINILFFGGFYFFLKNICILILFIIIPKMALCRLKINYMFFFFCFYMFFYIVFFL